MSGSFIIAAATTHSSFLLGILCISKYSLELGAGLVQWCHQYLQESPTTAFHLMTDCQDSLFFYLVVKSDSCFFCSCFQSLGSPHSAVKEHSVRGGICGTLWGETGVTYWVVRRRSHLIRRVLPQFYTVNAVSLCEFGSCTYGSVKPLQYSWSFIIKSSIQWGLCLHCSNLPCQHQFHDAVEEMHFRGKQSE